MSNLTAPAPGAAFPVPSERTARSFSGIYLVLACLSDSGLDRELDRYVNSGRSGKTAPGAGFRYNLKGVYANLPYVKEENSFRVTDTAFVQSVRERYGNDPVILQLRKEAIARYNAAKKANTPAKKA